jgi:hypothetical protein
MKGSRFHDIRMIPNNCRLQVPVPNRWYQQMFWTTAQSLGLLYQITWGLLWCTQHWVTGKFTETKILSTNVPITAHVCKDTHKLLAGLASIYDHCPCICNRNEMHQPGRHSDTINSICQDCDVTF